MNVYISVVSHGHDSLIKELGCLKLLSEKFNIIIKSNKPNDNFDELVTCKKIHWIDDELNYSLGFGHNNNIVFEYCINNLGMKDNDLFIVFNPDVSMDIDQICQLSSKMNKGNIDFSCINLFKDKEYSVYDFSIRKFPVLSQFVKSFLGLGNSSILDKKMIDNAIFVDWAAGSFLAFSVQHYKKLKGFDEKYFMYCEDIDICYRSKKLGVPIFYYPNIKALHYAKHENRKLMSKHLYWHLSSVFRFLLTKKGLTKSSSSLVN